MRCPITAQQRSCRLLPNSRRHFLVSPKSGQALFCHMLPFLRQGGLGPDSHSGPFPQVPAARLRRHLLRSPAASCPDLIVRVLRWKSSFRLCPYL